MKFETTFRVGGFKCSLRVDVQRDGVRIAPARWDPHVPQRLSAQELAQYRAGRDALLREVERAIGAGIAVVELG